MLALEPGARPCIHCGFCCQQAPCPFGAHAAKSFSCLFLEKQPEGWFCSIATEIMQLPGWEFAPAFGAGCCSPCNSKRIALEREEP